MNTLFERRDHTRPHEMLPRDIVSDWDALDDDALNDAVRAKVHFGMSARTRAAIFIRWRRLNRPDLEGLYSWQCPKSVTALFDCSEAWQVRA